MVKFLDHNLKFLKKDRKWLEKQLKKKHKKEMDEIADITLALYNQQRTLDIDTDQPNDHDSHNPYDYKPRNEN